jgi:hypothetical protein
MGIDLDCGQEKMRALIIILLLSSTTCFAQKTKIDYIVFGVYCGECDHHCATMFKIENNKILVDTTDSYFRHKKDTIIFSDYEPGKEFYNEAKAAIDSIPEILLDTNLDTKVFGEPDARDQCGIYVQFKTNNRVRTFLIDTEPENGNDIPKELRVYRKIIRRIHYKFYQMVWDR